MPAGSKARNTGVKSQSSHPKHVPAANGTEQPNTKKRGSPRRTLSPSASFERTIKPQAAPPNKPEPLPALDADAETAASAAAGVNKKKQKRRMKEAAKRAAVDSEKTDPSLGGMSVHANGIDDRHTYDPQQSIYSSADGGMTGYQSHEKPPGSMDQEFFSQSFIVQDPPNVVSKKKKGKDGSKQPPLQSVPGTQPLSHSNHHMRVSSPLPAPLLPSHPSSISQSIGSGKRDRIWNTSTAEERERIKEFWLGLAESERRGLVRIEKEAVLKKMKEQQKHSCSCTVCGRKRTAIEEELEILYDAYYDELESYANQQHFGFNASALPPPRAYTRSASVFPTNERLRSRGAAYPGEAHPNDFEETDEAYSVDEEDDESSDEEVSPSVGPSGGIFDFGNSLTAQGGILTVADDLLKNDGKKFIEMMEQLAERRMQREEESRMVANGMGHPSMRQPPLEEDELGYDEDDEEDDDYNSEEEDEFEEDDMEAMSEEQRMEEGRRMFQIFAARMFEQRVLNAYRQKVAEERQRKLIEELDEDEQLDAQREAKRAKEAQKKKDKRQKQKQAKEEERAKKDAERAAQEAAAKAIEEKKAEEQRQKKEEQKKKREAERRIAVDDRKRKEEEAQRQRQERRDQQAELERKHREQRESEKKKREDARLRDLAEREAKEKQKQEREASLQTQREDTRTATAKSRDEVKPEEPLVKPAAPIPKRVSSANAGASATQTSSHSSHAPSAHASPRLPIATPVFPKPPTPGRTKQRSTQESRNASPKPAPPVTSSTTSPTESSETNKSATNLDSRTSSRLESKQSPAFQPHFPSIAAPPGLGPQLPGFSGALPPLTNGLPNMTVPSSSGGRNGPLQHPPGFQDQPFATMHPYWNPNVPFPPGFQPPRSFSGSQQGGKATQFPQGSDEVLSNSKSNTSNRFAPASGSAAPQSHSRNQSASSNISPREGNQRPAPIQRPSSVAPHQQKENPTSLGMDVDDLSGHLGSSALLDDTDDAPDTGIDSLRRDSVAVGGPRPSRLGNIGSAPGFAPIGSGSRAENANQATNPIWSHGHGGFNAPVQASQPHSYMPMFGRPGNNIHPFGPGSTANKAGNPRLLRIRLLVCNACDKAYNFHPTNQGWHLAENVLGEVQAMMTRNEPVVSLGEMLQACELFGNPQNGGGQLELRPHESAGLLVKYFPNADGVSNGKGAPGEIGSAAPSAQVGSKMAPLNHLVPGPFQ